MALELPRKLSELQAAESSPASVLATPGFGKRTAPVTRTWHPLAVRAIEIVPGALALFLISTLVWGFVWFPREIATGLLFFNAYWLWKSWTIGYHSLKGVRLMRQYQKRNWRSDYRLIAEQCLDVLPWESVRHVVIIPNYKEDMDKLRATLRTLARVSGARLNVIPVLAMEETEEGCRQKGRMLQNEFEGAFYEFLVTHHPSGLAGEIRGKSSNEDWAARRSVEELVDRRGLNIDHLTVTSCDADTQFPPQYFDCLTFHFATDRSRYRRFWQAPIFFYNNIWQVPGPLRIPNALAGLIHLSRLSRKRRVLFSQSTYSLSMRMAREVNYWDTDVIPEDWHMFLKCFYELGGVVEVEPMFLPLGNDGALSSTPRRTLVNHYLQVRRWGWGAVDVAYAMQQAVSHPDIPLRKRFLRFWYFFENHLMWSTQWFFVTLGGLVPMLYWRFTGNIIIPEYFYLHTINGLQFLPGWLTITTLIMTPCLIPYFILIVLDARLRPPHPKEMSRLSRVLSHAWWLGTSPITFFCSALPALDAQIRLMLGKRMEYRVTEKVATPDIAAG
jgi:hypothetical protein